MEWMTDEINPAVRVLIEAAPDQLPDTMQTLSKATREANAIIEAIEKKQNKLDEAQSKSQLR